MDTHFFLYKSRAGSNHLAGRMFDTPALDGENYFLGISTAIFLENVVVVIAADYNYGYLIIFLQLWMILFKYVILMVIGEDSSY